MTKHNNKNVQNKNMQIMRYYTANGHNESFSTEHLHCKTAMNVHYKAKIYNV